MPTLNENFNICASSFFRKNKNENVREESFAEITIKKFHVVQRRPKNEGRNKRKYTMMTGILLFHRSRSRFSYNSFQSISGDVT